MIYAHASGHCGKINQDIDPARVPALPEKSPGPYKAFRDAFLEQICDHHGVVPRKPILALASDFEISPPFYIFEFDVQTPLVDPLFESGEYPLQEVIIDQNRGSSHQYGIEPIRCLGLKHRSVSRDRATGFLVQDVLNERGGGCLLEVGDDNRSDVGAQSLHFNRENLPKGAIFCGSICHHPTYGGGAQSGPRSCNLDPEHP